VPGDLIERIEALMPPTHEISVHTEGSMLVVVGTPINGDTSTGFELHVEIEDRGDDAIVDDVRVMVSHEPWNFQRTVWPNG